MAPLWRPSALCSHACEEKVLGGKQIGAPAAAAPVRCICFSTVEVYTEHILGKKRTGNRTVRNWCLLTLLIEHRETGAPGTEGPCLPQVLPLPRHGLPRYRPFPPVRGFFAFHLRPPRAMGDSRLHHCRWKPVGGTPCAWRSDRAPAWAPRGQSVPVWVASCHVVQT